MSTPVLVTGGTGTLGQLVLPRLRARDREVRVLSRREHPATDGISYVTGDLGTGAGVEAALTGVRTVLHLAGGQKGDGDKARTLVRAATAAGVEHLVFISVVGCDQPGMFGYYREQHAAEQVIDGSGLAHTTLRATQFHELLLMAAKALTKLPVVPVPTGFRFQTIAAAEVADRLVELALGAPAGRVPDLGGPQTLDMRTMVRDYLTATGTRRLTVPLPVPGTAARVFRAGANLAPEHAVGTTTWAKFLAETVARHPKVS